jgi:hypothetical protein
LSLLPAFVLLCTTRSSSGFCSSQRSHLVEVPRSRLERGPLTRLASNNLKEKESVKGKSPVGYVEPNGNKKSKLKHAVNGETGRVPTSLDVLGEKAVDDVVELIAEIDRRVSVGSTEIMNNLTQVMYDRVDNLPKGAADELATYLTDLAAQVQKAQQRELQRQLAEIEARFVRPFEELAFSDVPLFREETIPADEYVNGAEGEVLILTGVNSTLAETKKMRTREILRNFNVAPVYYTIALCLRWARKASEPSVYLMRLLKSMATVIKSAPKNGKNQASYEEYLKDAESMQAGWKRTGEIAAKGPIARKWAIMRRSAEIWAYFSSFYLKDRRITKNYQSGRWDDARFSEERSKLGSEIVQNLLKLGPTFIKVSTQVQRCLPLVMTCSRR